MSKPQDDGGYSLPRIVDPPRRCIQFDVPDEPYHVAAFFGALVSLAYWYNWQRDDAHTGKDVASVWFDVFNQASRNWLDKDGCCDCSRAEGSGCMGCCMRIENGILQSKDECGDWQDVPGQPPGGIFGGPQPGQGAPQPTPGGGCVTQHAVLDAKGNWLLPNLVNAGDTITLSNGNGAANDTAFSIDNWYCPTGFRFLGGFCLNQIATSGSDPVPSAPHMSVIVNISGTFYAIPFDAPFTVPSGVVNAQPTFQANDSALNDNMGTWTFDVQVCNNQAAAWHHEINLATNPLMWTPCGNGQFSAGLGMTDTLVHSGPNNYRGVNLCASGLPAFTLTRFQFSAGATLGANPQNVDVLLQPGNIVVLNEANVAGIKLYDTGIISQAGVTSIEIDDSVGEANFPTDPGGSLTISTIIVDGVGPDPFV